MITEMLETLFLLLAAVMIAYLVRHFIFTLTVLRSPNKVRINPELHSNFEPTVSILIPVFNEEKVIGRLLSRIAASTYPKEKLQIIVINDASNDQTGRIADQFKTSHPFIDVLHRDPAIGRRGKASAMNHGFSKCTGEILLCFDADYYPQRDIVESLVEPFADPNVGLVQGRVVVGNEPQNTVTRLVALERTGGYRVDQEARNILGLIPQFGGTVGGIRSSLLRSLGGWDESILAEDTDLTFRVRLAGYKIIYRVDAQCYEEAVDNWRSYWRQRYRWAKGHMQCFFKHALKVLLSRNLSLKEKIDGLMLLNVYFIPILALLSWLIGLPLIFQNSALTSAFWFAWLAIPISLYSFVGNFAPFFEVGIGLYLDGRKRTQWLIPLLLFTFALNIPLCMKAFIDLAFSKVFRRHRNVWLKTTHTGNGNYYIGSHK